jgi:hypothetical protein
MEFGYIGLFIGQIPQLLVLIAGIILLAARRQTMPGKAAGAGIAGLVAIMLGMLLSTAWLIGLSNLSYDLGYSEIAPLMSIVSLVVAFLNATGIGLLIVAVLIRGPRPEQNFAGFGPMPPQPTSSPYDPSTPAV